MENHTPTGLKQLIQTMCPEGPSVIEATVKATSPLLIALANDSQMTLSANSLIVPRHLTDYTTTADIYHSSLISSVNKATLVVHNALKQGDAVYLLAFNNGKQYYILDRKGG